MTRPSSATSLSWASFGCISDVLARFKIHQPDEGALELLDQFSGGRCRAWRPPEAASAWCSRLKRLQPRLKYLISQCLSARDAISAPMQIIRVRVAWGISHRSPWLVPYRPRDAAWSRNGGEARYRFEVPDEYVIQRAEHQSTQPQFWKSSTTLTPMTVQTSHVSPQSDAVQPVRHLFIATLLLIAAAHTKQKGNAYA